MSEPELKVYRFRNKKDKTIFLATGDDVETTTAFYNVIGPDGVETDIPKDAWEAAGSFPTDRPDQARDRDTIRRDTFVAALSIGFKVQIAPTLEKGRYVLNLLEPPSSANTESPKISLVFDDRNALDDFVYQVTMGHATLSREGQFS